MSGRIFHIFRNSPLGRENLLQAIYLCQQLKDCDLRVYRPTFHQVLLYLDRDVLTLDLDATYTAHRESSLENMLAVLEPSGVRFEDYQPTRFTRRIIPDIDPDFAIMSCPRVIGDSTGRVGLSHLGPKVRAIIKQARFPVFVGCGAFKPWRSVAAFFGGSDVGLAAARLGASVAERAGVGLEVFTQATDCDPAECERQLDRAGLLDKINERESWRWTRFTDGSLQANLMRVPYDGLAVIGATGRSRIRDLLFGSTLEMVQTNLPNPLLIVGPNYRFDDA